MTCETAVLALVSPRYYEDNGNTDRADDYDYNGLRTALPKDFSRTKAIGSGAKDLLVGSLLL